MLICLDQRTGTGCGAENRDTANHCNHCGKPLRFAVALRNPGEVIGRYQIVRVIGHGGFGAVYEAIDTHDPSLHVAIKETFDSESIRGFHNEFAVLSQLQHPNLPCYYAMFEADGNGYLVMEFVPGQSLQEILDRKPGPLLENQVVGYAIQLCDALAYLHAQQPSILHRDIKPANIRLTPEGLIKLVDFGLLKQGGQHTRHSIRGMGTPTYAPIEQYSRHQQHTDPRSDLYSLGATLYALLAGQEPLSATERIAATPDPLIPLKQLNPQLSDYISTAVMSALCISQQERHTDAMALKWALLGIVTTRAPSSPFVGATSTIPSSAGQPTQRIATPTNEASMPKNQERPYRSFNTPKRNVQAHLVNVLPDSVGYVYSVAFSPNGKMLASSNSLSAIIWSVEDSKSLYTLEGHRAAVTCIAWHPSARLLASVSEDRDIRLWSSADGSSFHSIRHHTDKVTSVVFSPGGQFMASAGWDRTVYVWRTDDWSLQHKLQGHSASVYHLAWSPDGETLVSTAQDRTIIWNIATGGMQYILRRDKDWVRSLAYSPDSQILASGTWGGDVQLWQAATGKPLLTLRGHDDVVRSVAYSPDGLLVASCSSDRTVRLWRVTDGRQVAQLEGHTDVVWSVAFSPDGQTLASASWDNTVRLWRIA